jgi:hypothetical protein
MSWPTGIKWELRKEPKIEPSSTGVSFVSILFALVVGAIMLSLQNWVKWPGSHSLPAAKVMHLVVALIITLTSWIGYHISQNRSRFEIRFVNIELVKFILDILMVGSYFILAAYSVRDPVTSRAETLLVAVAFALYVLWDLTSWYQRRNRSKNPYKREWDRAVLDTKRIDVYVPWTPVNKWRTLPSFVGLVLTTAICWIEWGMGSTMGSYPQFSSRTSVLIDICLIVIILGYRIWKDVLPGSAR